MQVARFYDFGDIRVEESSRPQVGPDDLLIRSIACGICSGDIMPWYLKRKAPLVLGHEPVGIVEQAGAAVREAREEISLEVELRALLGVYSRPDRDPRGQTITLVYVGRASGTPRGDDDAKNATLCDPRNPPSPLAFDHVEILADYVHWLDTGEFPAPWRKS